MDLHFRDVSTHDELRNFIKEAKESGKKLYLEIGYGSGIVLRKRVLKESDVFHIGFEIKGKFVYRMNKFKEKYQVENIYVEKADAKYVIPRFVENESFDKIFIYYPDPWWKKKHKKYILFDYDFISDLHRALKPEGTLNIKTDVVDYYNLIMEKFNNFQKFKEVPFDDWAATDNSSTFEIRGVKKGHELNEVAFTKI